MTACGSGSHDGGLACHGVAIAFALAAAASLAAQDQAPAPKGGAVKGTVVALGSVASRHVAARNVDVWLPPGYEAAPATRYPVLYVHDGQNVFDARTSFGGEEWGLDEAMARLAADGRIREALVVAIWNSPRRFAEYMPQKPAATPRGRKALAEAPPGFDDEPISDAYLRFLVGELKPAIDARFRTRPGREDTSIMGSSMGGLISLYAVLEYPDVFGAAACLSTHWPAGDGLVVDYARAALPHAGRHRFYFDFGTLGLDASYEPYQARMDEVMRSAGYTPGRDWVTRKFEGADHNERSWRARLDVPLVFLLGAGR